jgi:protein-tyrosine phosphatase
MAEGIFSKHLSHNIDVHAIQVKSAGIDALVDLTPDRKTKEVCNAQGVHVSSHKARQLTKEMLEKSDIILCMEKVHKQRIFSAFPKFTKNVFLLKEYLQKDSIGNTEVKDPIGKSKKYYEKCFKEIEKEVQRIVPIILRGNA